MTIDEIEIDKIYKPGWRASVAAFEARPRPLHFNMPCVPIHLPGPKQIGSGNAEGVSK